MGQKRKYDIHVLDEWEHTVGNHIENRIKTLINIHKRKKQILKKLHDKYVLVPADKASNNVVVICKNITLKL